MGTVWGPNLCIYGQANVFVLWTWRVRILKECEHYLLETFTVNGRRAEFPMEVLETTAGEF